MFVTPEEFESKQIIWASHRPQTVGRETGRIISQLFQDLYDGCFDIETQPMNQSEWLVLYLKDDLNILIRERVMECVIGMLKIDPYNWKDAKWRFRSEFYSKYDYDSSTQYVRVQLRIK